MNETDEEQFTIWKKKSLKRTVKEKLRRENNQELQFYFLSK